MSHRVSTWRNTHKPSARGENPPATFARSIRLANAIRTNKPYVEAEQTAISTLAAIMGRISAYTGKEVTWEEMMNSNLTLGPTELKWGPVIIDKSIPVPGEAK